MLLGRSLPRAPSLSPPSSLPRLPPPPRSVSAHAKISPSPNPSSALASVRSGPSPTSQHGLSSAPSRHRPLPSQCRQRRRPLPAAPPPAPASGPLSSALSPEASGCTPQRTPSAWTWVTDAHSPGSPCTALRSPRPGCRSLPLLVPRSLLCSLSASTRSCSRASTRPCVDGSQHALSAQGSPNLTGHVMCHTGSPPLPGSFLSSGFLVPPPSRPGVTSSEPGPSPS